MSQKPPLFQQKTPVFDTQKVNKTILQGFLKQYQQPGIKRTHLFEDRYENIYLNEQHIPELIPLIKQAIEFAEDILQTKNLRTGFWFNYMPPGATTTLHTHDDDDELLSCVYYVDVPENSGNLILYPGATSPGVSDNGEMIEIDSTTGEFIFFKPDVRHEVTRNNSDENRLSIGFNFGKAD